VDTSEDAMSTDAEYIARIQEAWRRHKPDTAHLWIGRILREWREERADE